MGRANIAEGCCRKGDAEIPPLRDGSASELEYELLLARDLKFVNLAHFQRLEAEVTEVKRMLAALLAKLNADN